ncbi:MAG: AAA family ATPase [Candidatus Wallbacteria bacterium]|nr:AAA family ATPase [Candidatus Wallbacteria bacterium]
MAGFPEWVADFTGISSPPGTGKTYATIDRALGIVGSSAVEDKGAAFNELIRLGRISFITFHQSFSYEDFIEGIKPALDKDETGKGLCYTLEDGVFKTICINAKFALYSVLSEKKVPGLGYNELFDAFVSDLKSKIGTEAAFTSKNGGKISLKKISSNMNLIVKPEDASRAYTVSRNRLEKLYDAFQSIDEIKPIDKSIRSIIGGSNSTCYWAVLDQLKKFESSSFQKIASTDSITEDLEYEEKKKLVENFDFKNLDAETIEKADKFAVVIDEINRGNIAKIFGELITLIENDKRLGGQNHLTALLPYSKQSFDVPPNLYIIGTMNTADRSVEALDTALRRRFSFEEFMPDTSVIREINADGYNALIEEGIDLCQMLETINNRIKLLYDRDHTIGHSFFLKVKEFEDLVRVFRDCIIPLLQEYFFSDWSKIQAVLGDQFIAGGEAKVTALHKSQKDLQEDIGEKIIYQLNPCSSWSKDSFKSIYE